MRHLAISVALSALAIAGCGGSDSTDPSSSVSVKFNQQMPLDVAFFEGTRTDIVLTDAEGNEFHSEDFSEPSAITRETMDSYTYDLGSIDLAPGVYEIDTAISACGGPGCSDEDLGDPLAICQTNIGIDADRRITVVYKKREQTPGCGFRSAVDGLTGFTESGRSQPR